MEVFKPDKFEGDLYHSTIIQSGTGSIDRYIYSQDGEGIGSFFGNLFRTAAPILGPLLKKAIKGTAKIVKPHLQRATTEVISAGTKRIANKISGNTRNNRRAKRRKTVNTKINHQYKGKHLHRT